jgi:hypothetical protein
MPNVKPRAAFDEPFRFLTSLLSTALVLCRQRRPGYSDLALISDEEFREGLAQLKSFCHRGQQEHADQPVYEDVDLFFFERP